MTDNLAANLPLCRLPPPPAPRRERPAQNSSVAPTEAPPPPPHRRHERRPAHEPAPAGAALAAGEAEADQEDWAEFSDTDSDTGLITGKAKPQSPPRRRQRGASDNENDDGDFDDEEDDDDEDDEEVGDGDSSSPESDDSEAGRMTPEQRRYYVSQFLTLCPQLGGKVGGQDAKRFLERSRLPAAELRRIWSLADKDKDGQLTVAEFCTAMHLVVLRRNSVPVASKSSRRRPPPGRVARERLLAGVKSLKEQNHTLVRLNNELLAEIKEVTEQRAALELELERVKP